MQNALLRVFQDEFQWDPLLALERFARGLTGLAVDAVVGAGFEWDEINTQERPSRPDGRVPNR